MIDFGLGKLRLWSAAAACSSLRTARVVLSDVEEFHMKKILIQYGVCALAVALVVPLAQAQGQPAGMQAAFAKDAGTLSEKFTGLARVMSGKYDWKPAQGVRSVADVFKTALPPARVQTPAPGTSFRD